MKKNVGSIDKVIRILLALLVITLYFTQVISGTVAVILLILAAILILTSVISFCPIYWPFGISTDKKKV
jgi:di/tricarboxylate transporter